MILLFFLFYFSESYTQSIAGGGSGPAPKPKNDWVQNESVKFENVLSSLLNWGNKDINMENPVADYNNFVDILKESQPTWNNDFNIYAEYINSRKDFLEDEMMQTLFNHWNNDFESPSNFDRYQFNPNIDLNFQENVDWGRVQIDMNNAVKKWFDTSLDDKPLEKNDIFNHFWRND